MWYLLIAVLFIAAYAWSKTVQLESELSTLRHRLKLLEEQIRKLSADSSSASVSKTRNKEKETSFTTPSSKPDPQKVPAVTTDTVLDGIPAPKTTPPSLTRIASPTRSEPTIDPTPAPTQIQTVPTCKTEQQAAKAPAEPAVARFGELGRRPPKESGESAESRLGVWWATRVGVLMAVIGAVFFGIYINIDAAPWLRLLQLTIGAGVFLALAVWFETKSPRIMPVIQSGALTALYVAAFGSYALSGIRIFNNPFPSAILQCVIVVGVVSFSLWKQRHAMVNFAVLLGYVAAWFSLAHALEVFSLSAALGWTVVAFWLRGKMGWTAPGSWSVAGNLALFALALNAWNQGTLASPSLALGWMFWFLVVGCTLGAEIWLRAEIRKSTQRSGRLYLWAASFGALGMGWLFTRRFHPDHLDLFYFAFGMLFLVGGWLAQKRELDISISLPLTLKGTLWIALGWMAILDGSARWLVLLGQTAIIAWMWPQRASKWVEAVWRGLWVSSLWYFLRESVSNSNPPVAWWASSLYLLGSFALFVWEASVLKLKSEVSLRKRWPMHGITGVLLAIAVIAGANLHFTKEYLGYAYLIWFLALAAFCWRMKLAPVAAVVAATFVGLVAQIWIWVHASWFGSSWVLLPQSTGWAIVIIGCTYLIWKYGPSRKVIPILEICLHVLWMLALMSGFWKGFPPQGGWIAMASIGLALPWVAKRFPFHSLRRVMPAPWILLLIFWMDGNSDWDLWLDWAMLAGAWISWILARPWYPKLKDSRNEDTPAWSQPGLIATVTGVLTMAVLYRRLEAPVIFYGLILMGLVYTLFWLKSAYRIGLLWSWIGLGLGLIQWMGMATSQLGTALDTPGNNWLISGLALGVSSCLLARVQTKKSMGQSQKERHAIQWVGSVAGLFFLFTVLSIPRFGLAQKLTLLMGVSAMSLFVFGMVFRSQPARFAALFGLGICILRLFIYDIQETLHRIFAFGALGVLLLGIGFLYNRFGKSMMEEDEEKSDTQSERTE